MTSEISKEYAEFKKQVDRISAELALEPQTSTALRELKQTLKVYYNRMLVCSIFERNAASILYCEVKIAINNKSEETCMESENKDVPALVYGKFHADTMIANEMCTKAVTLDDITNSMSILVRSMPITKGLSDKECESIGYAFTTVGNKIKSKRHKIIFEMIEQASRGISAEYQHGVTNEMTAFHNVNELIGVETLRSIRLGTSELKGAANK